MKTATDKLKEYSNGCAYEYSTALHVIPFSEAVKALDEYAAQYKADNDRLREALEMVVENTYVSEHGATKSNINTELQGLISNALNHKEKEV